MGMMTRVKSLLIQQNGSRDPRVHFALGERRQDELLQRVSRGSKDADDCDGLPRGGDTDTYHRATLPAAGNVGSVDEGVHYPSRRAGPHRTTL